MRKNTQMIATTVAAAASLFLGGCNAAKEGNVFMTAKGTVVGFQGGGSGSYDLPSAEMNLPGSKNYSADFCRFLETRLQEGAWEYIPTSIPEDEEETLQKYNRGLNNLCNKK